MSEEPEMEIPDW